MLLAFLQLASQIWVPLAPARIEWYNPSLLVGFTFRGAGLVCAVSVAAASLRQTGDTVQGGFFSSGTHGCGRVCWVPEVAAGPGLHWWLLGGSVSVAPRAVAIEITAY